MLQTRWAGLGFSLSWPERTNAFTSKANNIPGLVDSVCCEGNIFTYLWKERNKILVYLFEFCFHLYQSGSGTV